MKKLVIPGNKLYFSSDWHCFHKNIMEYDKRPFTTMDEMNHTIINNAADLNEDDHLFFLGDLAFTKDPMDIVKLLEPIKCKITWILGNHDHSDLLKCKELVARFESIKEFGTHIYALDETLTKNTPKNKQLIVLCHYSLRVWNKSHHGSWMLFGHSHCNLPDIGGKTLDVGVMNSHCNWAPFSYAQVKKIMDSREILVLDHHNEETA